MTVVVIKSFQPQAAYSTSPPRFRTIDASHRSATKSADSRRGAADDGELHQAAKPAASKGVVYKRDTSHRRGKCLS